MEKEAEAEAITGKVFDKSFQRLDVSAFYCSDTMLSFRSAQSINSSSQPELVKCFALIFILIEYMSFSIIQKQLLTRT